VRMRPHESSVCRAISTEADVSKPGLFLNVKDAVHSAMEDHDAFARNLSLSRKSGVRCYRSTHHGVTSRTHRRP
jgi:hypothetical protein